LTPVTDPEALAELGFFQLTSALADRAETPLGKARCRDLPLLNDRAAIELHLTEVEEARSLIRGRQPAPLFGMGDLTLVLPRAEKQGVLEGTALIEVASFARGAMRLRAYLEDHAPQAPNLSVHADGLAELASLAARIEQACEPSGRVSDRASPSLGQLRERSRELHHSMRERLDALLKDEHFKLYLREGYLTLRNGRYCVPVLSQFRSQVPGLVHNSSQSGQTLFVEPQPLISLGNDLAIAESMAAEEEQRILMALTAEVGRAARDLRQSMLAATVVDEIFAGAQLAEDMAAQRPEVINADRPFELHGLRHPLLSLQARAGGNPVVSSDVTLTGKARALVISGPNAGGKTVTLTAIGLSAAMVRAGLPICALPGSRVPLVSAIFAAIGDAQDLTRGLSTFTAHLAALGRLLREAGPGTLALIDEIAADTDPREGGALATAVLEGLVERGAVAVVTTHLEPLKMLALGDPRFATAAVGFDAQAQKPNFKLTLGVAGSSSALEMARRSGLPEAIVARAREHLTAQSGPLGKALEALETERLRLSEAREVAEQVAKRLAAERESLASQDRELAARELALERGGRETFLAELREARAQVALTLESLRAQPNLRAVANAQKHLAGAEEAQQEKLTPPERRTTAAQLLVGRWVRSRGLHREGELIQIEGDEATVAMGAFKVRRPTSDLEMIPGRPTGAGPTPRKAKLLARAEESAAGELPLDTSSVDLRGLRTEEAMRTAQRFLDDAFSSGASEVHILHGLGSGALRASLRRLLVEMSHVRNFRSGSVNEGGEGTTVVELA
jgi:DNA mismatch repair protein MutS2